MQLICQNIEGVWVWEWQEIIRLPWRGNYGGILFKGEISLGFMFIQEVSSRGVFCVSSTFTESFSDTEGYFKVFSFLKDGYTWRIGNGLQASLWFDRWMTKSGSLQLSLAMILLPEFLILWKQIFTGRAYGNLIFPKNNSFCLWKLEWQTSN